MDDNEGIATPSNHTVPPFDKPDGTSATKSKDKIASYFSGNISVPDPERLPPEIPWQINPCLTNIHIILAKAWRMLSPVDVSNGTDPDNIRPHTLKHCDYHLAAPLIRLFQSCISCQKWRQIGFHPQEEKGTLPENCRPVTMLSVVA